MEIFSLGNAFMVAGGERAGNTGNHDSGVVFVERDSDGRTAIDCLGCAHLLFRLSPSGKDLGDNEKRVGPSSAQASGIK